MPASSSPALEPKCRSSVCLVVPARAAIASSEACSQSPAKNTASAASSSPSRVRSLARARLTWVYGREGDIRVTDGNTKGRGAQVVSSRPAPEGGAT